MDLNEYLANCQKMLGSKRGFTSDDQDSDDKEEDEGAEDSDEITFVEEESESEPELDCDTWDNDCRVLDIKSKTSLTGYHLMPTCCRDPDLNPKKRIKIAQPEININLTTDEFYKQFQTKWNQNQKFTFHNAELIVDPFKVCVVNNFLENANIFNNIRHEFDEIQWNVRCMDLYEFFQSADLKTLNAFPSIQSIYQFLKNDVMKWMCQLTGYELVNISATCSYYSNTDYLLVHDDQREDRKVAFVLYFTGLEKWTEEKGGALQLFDKDACGQPNKAVRDIFPNNNQFVFFPVTNDSYHQVAEVMSISDCRFSINGWFHTKLPPVFQTPAFEPPSDGLYSDKCLPSVEFDIELPSWLNADYLKSGIAAEIQEYFEEHSEICLKKFFKQESFEAISQVLQSDSTKWTRVGPLNRYNYEVLDKTDVPIVLERFLKLFQSKQMFELLQKLTDLDLTKKSARIKYELQRWTPGCYSLLSDYNWHQKKELDLIIHFGCSDISQVLGARTQYVVIDDEVQNALITIDPEENNLNIIYRDTARFTKYYSKQSKCAVFYTFICSYSE